jgi:hypothetical protein
MMSVDGVSGDMSVRKNSTTSIVGAGSITDCDVTVKSLLLLLLLLSLFTQRQAFFLPHTATALTFLACPPLTPAAAAAAAAQPACVEVLAYTLPCALELLLLILL